MWLEAGRTEVVSYTANPQFITPFCTSYSFERQQQLRFEVYEATALFEEGVLTRHALLGETLFNIHELVCTSSQTVSKEVIAAAGIRRKGAKPLITLSSEAAETSSEAIRMIWEVEGLGDFLILRILREHEGDRLQVPIYESERCETHPAHWKPVKLPVAALCKGDESRLITLEIYRIQRSQSRTFLGAITTTLSELRKQRTNFCIDICKTDSSAIGVIRLIDFAIIEEFSFLDYVNGGCEISLVIGVDFTKSNGNPLEKTSLHYLEGTQVNEYVQAIMEVGEILQYYDSDKKIPVFGFGAKLPPDFKHISHCFALNKDIFDPEVKGIAQVVEVYKRTCKEVTFHGPTMFSSLIHMAACYASSRPVNQENQQYYILLILTDGIINDMEATLNEIVEASVLPMSIIIVGVGGENFEMMKVLDADEQPLFSKSTKKQMSRDIVQFVPFREVRENQLELARQVLFEVPGQLLSYMTSAGIRPKSAKANRAASQVSNSLASVRRIHLPPLTEPSRVFESLRSAFVEEMVHLGYDKATVLELTDSGIYCADIDYAIDLLGSPRAGYKSPPSALKSALRKPFIRREGRTRSGKVVRLAASEEEVCRICRERGIDTVFLDCGHRVVCQTCVMTLEGKECPVCRKVFARWVVTYDV